MREFRFPLKTIKDLYKALDYVEDWQFARKLSFILFTLTAYVILFGLCIWESGKNKDKRIELSPEQSELGQR